MVVDRREGGDASDVLGDVRVRGIDTGIVVGKGRNVEEAFDLRACIDCVGGEGLDLGGWIFE